MVVIRGESCFEENAFENTENPHPPTKTRLNSGERISREIFEILKTFLFCFEALHTAYFIPWKTQF